MPSRERNNLPNQDFALFTIPVLAHKSNHLELRAGLVLRLGAAFGFVMTSPCIVLSIFAIVNVQSSWEYSAKTAGAIIGANLLGIAIYRWGRRPRRHSAQAL